MHRELEEIIRKQGDRQSTGEAGQGVEERGEDTAAEEK
jgi:hypothetical protein